jgi:hypothetical protein
MMTILLMLSFLFADFVQKWNLPQGIDWGASRIVVGDTDRDGNYELIFSTYGGSFTIYFYELHLPDVWVIDSVTDLDQPLLWDIGDFDVDGFYDLVMQSSWGPPSVGISIYESPDSFSYPSQEVWRDTVGSSLVTPVCAYDIDQDSLPEIVKVLGDYIHLHIYETISNNLYDKIAEITTASTYNSSSTLAFGDFDSDNQNEFVWGYTDGEYSVWESVGDNLYQEISLLQLPTVNIKDCFSIPDADGDGKLEFVVKGYVGPSARVNAFIFEAISDNTYEIVKSFDLFGGHNSYYGGYSDVGDVDGDTIAEIALEACQTIYIMKAAGNDSFYVWETLLGSNSGSSVRVYDIDGNGLSEVIISGNNETRIYEYQVAITELVNTDIQHVRFELSPNPFRDRLRIVLKCPERHKAELKIYDVSGRLVKQYRRLNSTQQNQIYWDGRDARGHNLPGGVYFLRLQAGDYCTTEKVLLIR